MAYESVYIEPFFAQLAFFSPEFLDRGSLWWLNTLTMKEDLGIEEGEGVLDDDVSKSSRPTVPGFLETLNIKCQEHCLKGEIVYCGRCGGLCRPRF